MPRKSAYYKNLSRDEERELLNRSSKYTLPYFKVLRAKVVLLDPQGLSNDQIAVNFPLALALLFLKSLKPERWRWQATQWLAPICTKGGSILAQISSTC